MHAVGTEPPLPRLITLPVVRVCRCGESLSMEMETDTGTCVECSKRLADAFGPLQAKVLIDPATCCWNWPAKKDSHGYGIFCVARRMYRSHRVSYELNKGPIPSGLCILHLCNNTSCCNPDHLIAGDHLLNMQHKVAADRQARGERNPNAKLTDEKVRLILSLRAQGQTMKKIADQVGVDDSNVTRVCTGESWKHLALARFFPHASTILTPGAFRATR